MSVRVRESGCPKMAIRVLKVLALVVFAAMIVLAVRILAFGPPPTPENRVMLQITRAEEAVELSSVTGLMKVVSNDYMDTADNGKKDIARLVVSALRGRERWEVSTELKSITVEADTARSDLKVTVWPADVMSDQVTYELTLTWQREGWTWRVLSSSGWQEADKDFGEIGEPPPPPR